MSLHLPPHPHTIAPDFSLSDLDGRPVRLSDRRGRIVVLCFWSAECRHAERSDAVLRPLLDQWGERVIYLPVASNANESPAQMRAAAAERDVPLPLWDANSAVADLYGVRVTPHFFVIDAGGVLRYQGGLDDTTFRKREATRWYVREAVEALLAGWQVEVDQSEPYGCTLVRFKGLIA
ncbi:MAG TPA: redoxin domain-containing protein [Anaerolineaceae bacterium]